MLRELRDIQHLMVRACMRHVMLFATFPFHVAQQMRGSGASAEQSQRRSSRVRQRYEDER